MTTELKSMPVTGRNGQHTMYFTQFYGGVDNGRMLQVTQNHQYVELTHYQALELAERLVKWAEDSNFIIDDTEV
jgi:hypothetical protein